MADPPTEQVTVMERLHRNDLLDRLWRIFPSGPIEWLLRGTFKATRRIELGDPIADIGILPPDKGQIVITTTYDKGICLGDFASFTIGSRRCAGPEIDRKEGNCFALRRLGDKALAGPGSVTGE